MRLLGLHAAVFVTLCGQLWGLPIETNSIACDDFPVEIVFLIDVTPTNITEFTVQQQRVLRTLRHIEMVTTKEQRRFSIIAFHHRAITLLELASPFSNDSKRVVSLISSLRPRTHIENSVAKAFDAAATQLRQYGKATAHKVVLLAHGGRNTDFVGETLKAVTAIESLGAEVFAISGSSLSNEYALLGYTGDRDRVVIQAQDTSNFFGLLDQAVGSCSSKFSPARSPPGKAFGVRSSAGQKKRVFSTELPCVHDKADVMIVLDTSGSIYSVFEDERQIALDLLNTFPKFAFFERLQVSVVRFAGSADVALPFSVGRSRDDVIKAVGNIKFTGQNTRIASAVELGVEELQRGKRKDARQVFILISDGHGQEYWNVVQATGRQLQDEGAELFAVSASRDYNKDELLIYVGDESRVFVGPKYQNFVPILSKYVRGCVTRGKSEIEGLSGEEEELDKGDVAIHPPSPPEDRFFTVESRSETTTTEMPRKIETIEGSATEESSEAEEEMEGSGGNDITELLTENMPEEENENEVPKEPKEIQVVPTLLTNEPSKQKDIAEPGSVKCDVDIVLIIDRSQSVDADFKKQIQVALHALQLFSPADYSTSRIRVGAVSFARDAKVELNLQSTDRDDVLEVVSSIEHSGGTTSAVEGARLAMARLLSNRRSTAKLLTLLFTDGQSQDYWRQLLMTAMKLREAPNSVLISYTASNQFSRSELKAWTANDDNIYLSNQESQFLKAVSKNVKNCESSKIAVAPESVVNEEITEKDSIVTGKSAEKKSARDDESGEKEMAAGEESTDNESGESMESLILNMVTATIKPGGEESAETTLPPKQEDSTTEKTVEQTEKIDEKKVKVDKTTMIPETVPETTTVESRAQGIRTANELEKIAEKPSTGLSSNCLVDLLFVIDVSTSVEEDFDKELQLAVDLIKRLTVDDLKTKVRVGITLFNSNATLKLDLGQMRSRSDLLDVLLSIDNTGGSTSVVSGIQLAIEQMEKHKRKEARQIVVLISDGNSQDHWNDVIKTSNKLRTTGAETYAVTVSQNYMFRELELYAGSKWNVYIDARIRQFLDDVLHSIQQCTLSEENDDSTSLFPFQRRSLCDSDLVDIVFVLDTTSSTEDFFRERQYAIDLVKTIPKALFEVRLSVSLITVGSKVEVQSELGSTPTRADVLYELERVPNSEGNFSIAKAVDRVLGELKSRHREGARSVVIFVSSGISQDSSTDVQKATSALHSSGSEVFAVSLTEDSDENILERVVSSEDKLYAKNRLDAFVTDVSKAITACTKEKKSAQLGSSISNPNSITGPLKALGDEENLVKLRDAKKCKFNKIDLQLIMDASSSREEVFEKQRELALSLIERLPISSDEAHVAVGINSFTSVPVLRQNLGLGRNKKMVRQVIEGISYNGGSTLTAQAVELSVEDLKRGKRPDALQAVILMNDGISQDKWENVLEASGHLAETGAERFGVALGKEVDLRELQLYVGSSDRIYRDNSTEKFLDDVVSLLGAGTDCSTEIKEKSKVHSPNLSRPSSLADCSRPNLDLLVLFDNTDKTENMTDPAVNSNRYLLLDVLGSLVEKAGVRVSVISFSDQPKIELDFTDISDRDRIFAKVEAIRAITGKASYSDAITVGLKMLAKEGRADARSSLIIVGDGHSSDTDKERNTVSKEIRNTGHLSCLAVDSSSRTDKDALVSFTGARENVFDYDRNALFAKKVEQMANAAKDPKCTVTISEVHKRILAAHVLEVDGEFKPNLEALVYSTIAPTDAKSGEEDNFPQKEVQRDLAGEPLQFKELSEDKVFTKKEPVQKIALPVATTEPTTTTQTTTTIQSTTTVPPSTTQPGTTTRATTLRTTTQATTRVTRPFTTPSFVPYFPLRPTESPVDAPTTFKPGCLLDVIMVLDSSGSVEETFKREKELAAGIIDMFRVGPNNARISLIKFAAAQKVRTIYSFNDDQSRGKILRKLEKVRFSSGTTAIHAALKQAVSEYSVEKGARPNEAVPIAILFTDGYGRKPVKEEAQMLRSLIPNTYAVAINHQYPISRKELEIITDDPERVFTDANIKDFHDVLKRFTRDCIVD